jgi:hypothetical protein
MLYATASSLNICCQGESLRRCNPYSTTICHHCHQRPIIMARCCITRGRSNKNLINIWKFVTQPISSTSSTALHVFSFADFNCETFMRNILQGINNTVTAMTIQLVNKTLEVNTNVSKFTPLKREQVHKIAMPSVCVSVLLSMFRSVRRCSRYTYLVGSLFHWPVQRHAF